MSRLLRRICATVDVAAPVPRAGPSGTPAQVAMAIGLGVVSGLVDRGSAMVICFASMKGGVGKTTLSVMFAKYVAERRGVRVTVADVDPQQGATALLLRPGRIDPKLAPSVFDVLRCEQAGGDSREVHRRALRASPGVGGVSVLPSSAALSQLEAPETPKDLLRKALIAFPVRGDELYIVDASPSVHLCELSVIAADTVFVPLTLSHQSGIPTLNTLRVALWHEVAIGGLVPMMLGHSKWQATRAEAWRSGLADTLICKGRGIPVLPVTPGSPAAPRGAWLNGRLPPSFLPVMEAIYAVLYGEQLKRPADDAGEPPGMRVPVGSGDVREGTVGR